MKAATSRAIRRRRRVKARGGRSPAARVLVLPGLLLSLGCGTLTPGGFSHGGREEDRRAIRSPHGEAMRLTIRMGSAGSGHDEVRSGELLEVRDDALRLSGYREIVHVPFAHIVEPAIDDVAGLRARARYPQGLTDSQLARLLATTGLARVDTLGIPVRAR